MKKVSQNSKSMIMILNSQVHKNSSYSLPPIFGVKFIKKVIKVWFILLSNFIMENLKPLTML